MARPILIKTAEYPYHITARANNKEWFYVDPDTAWEIFCKQLEQTQIKYNLEVHAFLMMRNHFHLICSTPDENIDKAMHYFMMMTSRSIGRTSDRINRIWGTRYFRSILNTEEYYAHAIRYLYSNPIRANITNHIKEYKWSTLLRKNLPQNCSILKVKDREGFNKYIPSEKNELENWINSSVDIYYNDNVRRALRRSEFKFPNNRPPEKYNDFKVFLPNR